jgi:sugar phosphate isomerase/epimerase
MIVLSTGSLYTYGLARVFNMAAAIGFDGLEVIVDRRKETRSAADLDRLSSDYGLPITSLHSPFVADIPGWPSDQLGRLKRTVALAGDLNVPLVVAHLPLRLCGLLRWLRAFGSFSFLLPIPRFWRGPFYDFLRSGRLQELESVSGVRVAIENMPARKILGLSVNPYWFNRPEQLSRFEHLTLDTTHLGTWNLDPLEIYRGLKQRVVHVHLSNFDGIEHRLPHDGHLALDEFLRCLTQERYPGAVCVETSPEALNAEVESQCSRTLAGVLAFCRENFTLNEH